MSWNPLTVPDPDPTRPDAIETVIVPRARDLGGFEVKRALPAPRRQMVGPFIFFDHIGPAEFLTGQGIDVRPHPHIGLGTVTYLFRGDFHHRDSLGTDRTITPGAVNWMVAGRGVTHSERTSPEGRRGPHSLLGVQTWVALPEREEERAPMFEHHGKGALPVIEDGGVRLRLILGRAYGAQAPATLFSDTFYADVGLAPNAAFPMPDDHEDRGIYVLEGMVEIAGQTFEAGRMMVLRPGDAVAVRAGPQGARLMILGGETLEGPRYIWWNFVSSSRDRIEEAKADWVRGAATGTWGLGRFDLPGGDRDEFIPAP